MTFRWMQKSRQVTSRGIVAFLVLWVVSLILLALYPEGVSYASVRSATTGEMPTPMKVNSGLR